MSQTSTVLQAVRDQIDDTLAAWSKMAIAIDLTPGDANAYKEARTKYGDLGEPIFVKATMEGVETDVARHYPALVPWRKIRDRVQKYIDLEREAATGKKISPLDELRL